MAPMKRSSAATRKSADPIKSRSKLIKEAIEESAPESCSASMKEMLTSTLKVTVGTKKVERHAFNQRFVDVIGEVLAKEQARLEKDIQDKEVSFAELTPAKGQREAASEEAKTEAAGKAAALEEAKKAVTDIGVTLKEANAALKEAEKAQKAGDAGLNEIEGKKKMLEDTQTESLGPLVGGTAENKTKAAKAVLDVGKNFSFDASLLQTAEPILTKEMADRGSFDATCLEQLQAAFTTAIAGLDEQLAAGAGGKAERAAAVEQAEAAKKDAEDKLAAAKEAVAAAKEAKSTADGAAKAAAQSLDDFMPDLKKAGDALDEAKDDLKDFTDGAMLSYTELKDLKEHDFYHERVYCSGKSYYQTIEGMKLARSILDMCHKLVVDGQISVDDAKLVLPEIADANKETRTERWTVRYILNEFNWVPAAKEWLLEELKKVPQEDAQEPEAKKAKTAGYYKSIDGYNCDGAIIDACNEAGEAPISEELAAKIWEKAADGNKVTICERWTLRYCLADLKWEPAAHAFVLGKLKETPLP